jgi:hypothetical protein
LRRSAGRDFVSGFDNVIVDFIIHLMICNLKEKYFLHGYRIIRIIEIVILALQRLLSEIVEKWMELDCSVIICGNECALR